MDMVDLILTVCLTANPGNCRDEHLYFESRGSLLQCMSSRQVKSPNGPGAPGPQGRALEMRFPGKEQTI